MIKENLNDKFSGFYSLMPERIQEILIVSSMYDAFILQEDGQLTEQLLTTFVNLNLRYAPRISWASTMERTLEILENQRIDLVIVMPQLGDMSPYKLSKKIKSEYPDIPTVLLAYNSKNMNYRLAEARKARFDSLFTWFGDSRIFLAIIKLIEDSLNVEHDVREADVRVIIIVEDSPGYYSSFLPVFYTVIMQQTQKLMHQGLNDMHKLMRMRARPKVLLVSTYEDALELYKKYNDNVLGIISDVNYPKDGKQDPEAGFKLIKEIKRQDRMLPALLMSNEPENRKRAYGIGAQFLDKNSRTLLRDIKNFIKTNFGFGDFIFKLPTGETVGVAKDLKSFYELLKTVPEESILFHSTFNHFSTWLMARSEFELARQIKHKSIQEFASAQDIREYMLSLIKKWRHSVKQGIITDFNLDNFDENTEFIRISGGSIGGKGRGISFIGKLLDNNPITEKYENVNIKIPLTLFIGTDAFDSFLEENDLRDFALESNDDHLIKKTFLKADFPELLTSNLKIFLEQIKTPLAVRSSSLLEDSHFLPFAGIYETHMYSNNAQTLEERLQGLLDKIKLVYASTFTSLAKSYLQSTSHRIEEEKMAVIIQEIVGRHYGDYFYPDFSGVAQSYNFFPISGMKPDEGVVNVALGMGKAIVDFGTGLLFSPKHPEILPQFPTIDDALKNSQTEFYALKLKDSENNNLTEDASYQKLPLTKAMEDGTLEALASTFVAADNIIRDSVHYPGPKIITFASILKYGKMPLAELISDMLDMGKFGMGTPVEIEFSVNLSKERGKPHDFYFLQIRPMVAGEEFLEVKTDKLDPDRILIYSDKSLGNGKIKNIRDLVYVDPRKFKASETRKIAEEIGKANAEMVDTPYVLIGLGRWGSSDPWLGIPVTWEQISNVEVMVETGMENFNIDVSMGTHFFHNIISRHIGYLTVPYGSKNGTVNWDKLHAEKSVGNYEYIRHIRFETPLEIRMDGRKSQAAILLGKSK